MPLALVFKLRPWCKTASVACVGTWTESVRRNVQGLALVDSSFVDSLSILRLTSVATGDVPPTKRAIGDRLRIIRQGVEETGFVKFFTNGAGTRLKSRLSGSTPADSESKRKVLTQVLMNEEQTGSEMAPRRSSHPHRNSHVSSSNSMHQEEDIRAEDVDGVPLGGGIRSGHVDGVPLGGRIESGDIDGGLLTGDIKGEDVNGVPLTTGINDGVLDGAPLTFDKSEPESNPIIVNTSPPHPFNRQLRDRKERKSYKHLLEPDSEDDDQDILDGSRSSKKARYDRRVCLNGRGGPGASS
jgi:hypothetical protein